jgi:hypothetical protein
MDEINIKYPTRKFDFTKLTLTYPKNVASGSYFTRILHMQSPLYLQIPKCTTKNGLVKSGKKMTCELLLDNMNEELVGWFESLDNRCKELLQQNSEEWFGNSITSEDIDNAFGTTTKLYKSGKYSLVKTNIKINNTTDTPILSVYDENQNQQTIESITNETNIVAILEISGIRFTSRHFNVEIEIKQIMTVDDAYEEDVYFNKCLIAPRAKNDVREIETPKLSLEFDTFPNICVKENQNVLSTNEKNKNETMNEPRNLGILEFSVKTEKEKEREETEQQKVLENEQHMEEELCELDCLQEIQLEEITLNKPEEIYYELYRKTKQKAKEALLEAKRIKEQYQLDVSDWETSDEEDEEDDD